MVAIVFKPSWFFGYDVLFELLFAFICILVAYYAYRIYRLTDNRQPKVFGIAFSLISISYILQSYLNFVLIKEMHESVFGVIDPALLNKTVLLVVGLHTYLYIAGLIALVYLALNTKDIKFYLIMLMISFVSLLFNMNKMYMYYLLCTLLLVFIFIHYMGNFMKNVKLNTFLVMLAFLFLLLANANFIFIRNNILFYVTGHFVELFAYVLILINLIQVLRK